MAFVISTVTTAVGTGRRVCPLLLAEQPGLPSLRGTDVLRRGGKGGGGGREKCFLRRFLSGLFLDNSGETSISEIFMWECVEP